MTSTWKILSRIAEASKYGYRVFFIYDESQWSFQLQYCYEL